MRRPSPKTIAEMTTYLLILALPFVVLSWLVPFHSDTTIGNDYGTFPIQQQMELNYSIEKGTFPLYAPGFAVGRSQAALTMGQLFHPISHLARITPGYWEGDALSLNTLYRLMGLGLAHLLVFIFLRRLRLPLLSALFLSVVTVYNMRMLDLFRYGASLENYCGYLMLCASLGFLFTEKHTIGASLAVIVSTWLLVVGGHPQMMYLGLLGAGLFALLLPFCAAAIRPDLKERLNFGSLRRYFLATAISVVLGMALSAPYILSFYVEFVSENALRVGQDYQWSLIYTDTVGGVFNSIFSPLEADVHGAFGSTPLLLLLPLTLMAVVSGVRVPAGVIASILVCAVIFLCLMGDATPVHYWFWKTVPLAQTFRVPGRMSMMLPPIMLLALCWLFAPAEKDRFYKWDKLPFTRLIIPAIAGVAIYVFYHNAILPDLTYPPRYSPETIISAKMNDTSLLTEMKDVTIPRLYWLGLITLVLSAVYAVRLPFRPALWRNIIAGILVVVVVVQVKSVLRYGTWQKENTPSKTLEIMDAEKSKGLTFYGSPGFGMESPDVTRQMERSILPVGMSQFYRNVIVVDTPDAADRELRLHRRSNVAIVESAPSRRIQPTSIAGIDRVELTFASFNKVVFSVDAKGDGLLTWQQPFDGRFRALVDGKEAAVVRANGLENGVMVPEGTHEVMFWYRSAATVTGVVLSLISLLGIGVVAFFTFFRGKWRWVATGLLAVSLTGWFVCWNASLYANQGVGTQYSWNSAMFTNPDNLAYGKAASMASIRSNQMPYFYYAGLAVDGNPTKGATQTHPRGARPWWQVDLGKSYTLGKMRFFNPHSLSRHLPVRIQVAQANGVFTNAVEITRNTLTQSRGVLELNLQGAEGRLVRVQSSAVGSLALSEVEIFEHVGPPPTPAPVYDDTTDPTGNLRHPVR